MFNVKNFSTSDLQQIACENIARLTDLRNPGNAQLAQACLDEIVQRESTAWELGHAGPMPQCVRILVVDMVEGV